MYDGPGSGIFAKRKIFLLYIPKTSGIRMIQRKKTYNNNSTTSWFCVDCECVFIRNMLVKLHSITKHCLHNLFLIIIRKSCPYGFFAFRFHLRWLFLLSSNSSSSFRFCNNLLIASSPPFFIDSRSCSFIFFGNLYHMKYPLLRWGDDEEIYTCMRDALSLLSVCSAHRHAYYSHFCKLETLFNMRSPFFTIWK